MILQLAVLIETLWLVTIYGNRFFDWLGRREQLDDGDL